MYDIAGHTAAQLPRTAPRYLMGAGMPNDLVEAVARGIDLFDCVLPTRNARNGQLFTRQGRSPSRMPDTPRTPAAGCGVRLSDLPRHSRAYLRHLFMAGEMSAASLNTVHNLHFYLDTMGGIRKAIEFGIFENFTREFLDSYSRRQPTDG